MMDDLEREREECRRLRFGPRWREALRRISWLNFITRRADGEQVPGNKK